jgi:hypothetical protein
MAQRNRENLGYLGEDFQYKLVHEFMDNHTFFEDLNPIIDQNMFTDPNLKTIVGVMKNYYEKYGNVPFYDNVGIELRDLSRSEKEKKRTSPYLTKSRQPTLAELKVQGRRQRNSFVSRTSLGLQTKYSKLPRKVTIMSMTGV